MNNVMTVNFRGAVLYGMEVGGIVCVAVRPIVDAMGISWHGQLERIKRDPILSEGVRMIRIPSARGGPQQSVSLPLDLIHGWFFTIEASRIRNEDVRGRVLAYQRECYDVLWEHFSGAREKIVPQSHQYESRSIRLINEARLIYGPRAAAQLWRKRGLPEVPAMAGIFAQPDLFEERAP